MKFLSMKTWIWLLVYVSLVAGQDEYELVASVSGDTAASDSVNISCVFSSQWTEERHPVAYPQANAYFSPMILASHNANYSMWATGELASGAIQIVAETGVKLTLLGDLEVSADVLDHQDGRAMYLANQQSFSLDAFRLDSDFPLVSAITKIGPSPDWFTGFTNFNPVDSSTGTYYESFEIDTFPFDGGTDSGASYRSEDIATDPPEPLLQLTPDTLPEDGVFLSSDGTDVLPVAKWTCTITSVEGTTSTVGPTPEATDAPEPTAAPTNATASTPAPSDTEVVSPTAVPTTPEVPPTASKPIGEQEETDAPTFAPTADVIPFTFISSQPGSVPSSEPVGFTCRFLNQWTKTRHPQDYPTDSAQWTPIVLTSHSVNYTVWGNGAIASIGLRSLAMTNSQDLLMAELGIAQSDGHILDYISGSELDLSKLENTTIGPLRVDADHPYISAVTMNLPSPDWFSGLYDFGPVNEATKMWYQSFIIESYPWDAGTDAGTTYKSEAMPRQPQGRISQFTAQTVPDSGVFLSPDGTTVDPVARWTCSQVAAPPVNPPSEATVTSLIIAFATSLMATLFVVL